MVKKLLKFVWNKLFSYYSFIHNSVKTFYVLQPLSQRFDEESSSCVALDSFEIPHWLERGTKHFL